MLKVSHPDHCYLFRRFIPLLIIWWIYSMIVIKGQIIIVCYAWQRPIKNLSANLNVGKDVFKNWSNSNNNTNTATFRWDGPRIPKGRDLDGGSGYIRQYIPSALPMVQTIFEFYLTTPKWFEPWLSIVVLYLHYRRAMREGGGTGAEGSNPSTVGY